MSNSTKLANPMKVITGKDTRWSYANVWEAKSINGGTPKFSVSLIIPKTDTVTVQKIKAAIQAAYEEGQAKLKGNGRTVPPLTAIKTPLRDGDTERPDDPAYAGSYFINANSATAPGIVDADCNPILTRSEVYSGVYGRASINFYAFNSNGNKGIACGLNNLQKIRDGDPSFRGRGHGGAYGSGDSKQAGVTSPPMRMKISCLKEVRTMNATTILCILLLSLYLVLAVFWIVRSIIDTIDDRKREKRNAALEAEREARNAKWEAERQQLERERAIREVEYHEARMKELEQK